MDQQTVIKKLKAILEIDHCLGEGKCHECPLHEEIFINGSFETNICEVLDILENALIDL